ncbi:hypothetical protein J6590_006554 [Homalodisca vitripennis]|nr:hypothetical protein J6590_006554 [Homalodisca vitripennis]
MIEDELLIELVKAHPFLYNPNDPDYHDNRRRERTWHEISENLESFTVQNISTTSHPPGEPDGAVVVGLGVKEVGDGGNLRILRVTTCQLLASHIVLDFHPISLFRGKALNHHRLSRMLLCYVIRTILRDAYQCEAAPDENVILLRDTHYFEGCLSVMLFCYGIRTILRDAYQCEAAPDENVILLRDTHYFERQRQMRMLFCYGIRTILRDAYQCEAVLYQMRMLFCYGIRNILRDVYQCEADGCRIPP